MICPRCATEYASGTTRCPACNVELVEATAAQVDTESDWSEDVVVLETVDESQLMVARSLLEAEGIPCFAPGEDSRQLVAAGPARLCVSPANEAAARALLEHLEPAPGD